MVNLTADNLKLKGRAQRIIAAVAEVDEDEAAQCLERADGAVKTAILIAAGADDLNVAKHLLERAHGRLRPALSMLRTSATTAQRTAS